jgi:TPR repeat protein
LDSIAEIGRQYLDGELEDTTQEEARRWLETAAELDHVESKFLLGMLLVTEKRSDTVVEAESMSAGSAETRAAAVLKEIREATKAARKARKERLMSKSKKQQQQSADDSAPRKLTDYEIGVDWLRQAARGDNAKAMCYLGNLLLNGSGSEKSEAIPDDAFEALLWYERASKLVPPSPDALFNLGTLYFDGREGLVTPDLIKSFSYFQRAADLNDISSQFWVGHCYLSGEGGVSRPDPVLALKYLKLAADGGHSSAMYHLATIYRSGLSVEDVLRVSSTSRNHDHSHEHDHACTHNHDHSHSHVHDSSPAACAPPPALTAPTVAANKELFFSYLHQAVAAEDADALYCLADMHIQGLEGLPKDEVKGRELVELASARGHAEATVSLGAMYYHGLCGLEKDARRAFELYNAAAELGSQEAWRNLAAMYYTGDGVPQSEETAKEIMRVIFGEDKTTHRDAADDRDHTTKAV